MSIRSLKRDNETLDQICVYFMRTILHLQKSGIEDLPLPHNLPEPFGSFLDASMDIFMQSPVPELARLLYETEYSARLSQNPMDAQTVLGLQVIKEVLFSLRYYQEDFYGYFLTTEELWGHTALEYAWRTFIPNLPPEIQARYGYAEVLETLPKDRFRLDDF